VGDKELIENFGGEIYSKKVQFENQGVGRNIILT
jgi:hypothetical protein